MRFTPQPHPPSQSSASFLLTPLHSNSFPPTFYCITAAPPLLVVSTTLGELQLLHMPKTFHHLKNDDALIPATTLLKGLLRVQSSITAMLAMPVLTAGVLFMLCVCVTFFSAMCEGTHIVQYRRSYIWFLRCSNMYEIVL